MANTVNAFFETLVAANEEYNAATVGALSFLQGVTLDVRPQIARAGQTLQVYFPDLPAFTQQGANDWNPVNLNPNYTDMVFSQNPGISFVVRDFEQWLTAVDIRDKFLDPAFKRGMEYLNAAIAALAIPANFTNPVIQGSTPQSIGSIDIARCWNALAKNKVPLASEADLFMFSHNDVYMNTMVNPSIVQENIVGALISQQARLTGAIPNTFRFQQKWDQSAGKTVSAALSGTVTVTNGSTAVTTTANLTGSITAGTTSVVFGNDPNGISYLVTAVTSTTLTLAVAYAGPTGAGVSVSTQQYYVLAAHRYAIGCALRPLPPPDKKVVDYTYVYMMGIPFRVAVSYQHIKDGYLVTVDFGYALQVLRPTFGQLLSC